MTLRSQIDTMFSEPPRNWGFDLSELLLRAFARWIVVASTLTDRRSPPMTYLGEMVDAAAAKLKSGNHTKAGPQ